MGLFEVSQVPWGHWVSCLEYLSVWMMTGLSEWGSSMSILFCSSGAGSSGASFWLFLLLAFSSSEAASSLNKMSTSLFFQKPSYTGVALGIRSPIFVRGLSEWVVRLVVSVSLRGPRGLFYLTIVLLFNFRLSL